MKVLMINGSPHAEGCTSRALAEVAKILHAENIETIDVVVGGQDIRGCTACNHCHKTGRCIFDDIVNKTADIMDGCDALVVGSPVYFSAPNASLLALLDRLFYARRKTLFGKLGASVVSARRAGTSSSLDVLNKYFLISSMPVMASTYWPMVHGFNAEDVEKDLEGLQTMRNLGRNMAWMLKSIEAGKKAGLAEVDTELGAFTHFIR